MKKERLREKTLADIQRSKQSTFDKLPEPKITRIHPNEKSIDIAQLEHIIKDNELVLSVAFRLLPSRKLFSNLMLELYFDNDKLNTYLISIPPSDLLSDQFEFPITLDMKGICPGTHVIKVELLEKWGTNEILTSASKYIMVQYDPSRKEDQYVKVPIVRKIDGAFRIIMPGEKDLYEQLERSHREELKSKKDYW